MRLGDFMRNPRSSGNYGIFVQGRDGLEYEISDPEARVPHDEGTSVAAWITLAYEAIDQEGWTLLVRNMETGETVWSYTTQHVRRRESPDTRAITFQHGAGEGGAEYWE